MTDDDDRDDLDVLHPDDRAILTDLGFDPDYVEIIPGWDDDGYEPDGVNP